MHNLELKISERDYVSSQRNTTYKLHIVEQTSKEKQNLEMRGPGGLGGGGGEHMKRRKPDKYEQGQQTETITGVSASLEDSKQKLSQV